MPDIPRAAAHRALARVFGGAFSAQALDAEIKRSGLSGRDAAFASACFFGTLERRISLSEMLKPFLKKTPEPHMEALLHLALYQILSMDSVPESAAVNTSVSLAKESPRLRHGAPFVNAVLRSALRAGKAKLFEIMESTEEGKFSCRSEIVDAVRCSVGNDEAQRFLSLFGPPPLYIRANTLKTSAEKLSEQLAAEGFRVRESFLRDCLLLEGSGAPQETEAFHQGLFHVQDLSSQLCCSIAAAMLQKDEHTVIFDLCAAPGSKSFTIAQLLGGKGRITATDIYQHKIEQIEAGARRLGASNIEAVLRDGRDFSNRENAADLVLCDLPCSGYGVIRKKPELRFSSHDISSLTTLSAELLQSAAKQTKPGGHLVFSTCTLNKSENEDAVRLLLSTNNSLKLLKIPSEFGILYEKVPFEDGEVLTVFPAAMGCDGFFTAVFEKR